MKKNALRIFVIVFIISMNIGCDQSTKYLAKKYLNPSNYIQVIDDYFVLHYAENKGGFLSLFSTLPKIVRIIILSIIPSIFLVLITYYVLRNKSMSLLYVLALCTIIGGGLSNIADRFNNDYVVDFMNIGIGNIRSGVFNFADLSIMLGSFLVLLLTFARSRKEKETSMPVQP
jgi:signal peptidase II